MRNFLPIPTLVEKKPRLQTMMTMHYMGCTGLINTLARAIATDPPATANKIYATVNAPRSSVRFPRELLGLSSSPIAIKSLSSSLSSKREGITTESKPVPNDAPTAIRRQNS
mmetsp:Transcript_19652/g.42115  ORF Transcript_19652/g.42115 Transcript_19652/m.42115 type:complete len:112 (+) Transcript_19652:261-596(+)